MQSSACSTEGPVAQLRDSILPSTELLLADQVFLWCRELDWDTDQFCAARRHSLKPVSLLKMLVCSYLCNSQLSLVLEVLIWSPTCKIYCPKCTLHHPDQGVPPFLLEFVFQQDTDALCCSKPDVFCVFGCFLQPWNLVSSYALHSEVGGATVPLVRLIPLINTTLQTEWGVCSIVTLFS